MITHPLLGDLARFGVRLGLERMAGFLSWLGDPHLGYPVVHVAGTNGKGSVVRMTAALLRAQGLRVGEYLSPHLQRVNERIQIDGQEISDAGLNAVLAELDTARRAWVQEALAGEIAAEAALTYFELMTAAAFLSFARARVDVAVVEVGLGGRLDATNVVRPRVCAITSVGIDHTEQLGPDLASIAAEKAGIIKVERPVVVGALPPAALRGGRSIAAERDAPLYELGKDFRLRQERDGRVGVVFGEQVYPDLLVPLAGDHQQENAAVALAALCVAGGVLTPSPDAARLGLAAARHPGRLERLAPDLLIDCAHNPEGAARLATWLREHPPAEGQKRTLLLGMSADKDARTLVVALAPLFDRVLTTHCSHPRALSAGDLAGQIVGVDVPVLPAGPIEQALPLARNGRDEVVVAGSVFLAGAVRDLVGL